MLKRGEIDWYGYSFVQYQRNGKLTKWAKALLYIHLSKKGAKRTDIAKNVWGFDDEHKNSSHGAFTAMQRKGLLTYNKHNQKWYLTNLGKSNVNNITDYIVKNVYLTL